MLLLMHVDVSGEMLEINAHCKDFSFQQIAEMIFAIGEAAKVHNFDFHAAHWNDDNKFVISYDVSGLLDSFESNDVARVYFSEVIYDNLPRYARKSLY